jgi:hypothetical protein
MSMLSLMRVLGHHSVKMTMRYAAVAPETIRGEYLAAIERIETRYDFEVAAAQLTPETDPVSAMSDVIRLVKHLGDSTNSATAKERIMLILKRLHRLKGELAGINLLPPANG